MMRSTAGVAAGALLIACAAARAGAAQKLPQAPLTPAQRADLAEERAYRLTAPGLQKAIAATNQFSAALKADANFQALAKAENELDALENKDAKTPQDEARIKQLEAQTKGAPFSGDPTKASLSELDAGLSRIPAVVSALKAHGLGTREYAKMMVVSMAAMIAGQMQQAGLAAQAAGRGTAGGQALGGLAQMFGNSLDVAPENVAFVNSHMSDVQQFLSALNAIDKP